MTDAFGNAAVRPRARLAATTLGLAVLLAACGGGGGGSSEGSSGGSAAAGTTDGGVTAAAFRDRPKSRADAARFLTQATFGPSSADVDDLMGIGYSAWIDDQFTRAQGSHRVTWEALDAQAKAVDANATIGQDGVINSFWKAAVSSKDQLRQRVAFALSEIFVISLQDSGVANDPRSVAAYLDMLGDKGFGNYRDLLQSVSMHPMMGTYLSSIRNQKDDPKTGRVPDQNYAREVMQLFTIGLEQLNGDGTRKLSADQPVDTYGPADVAGLARVFTGWSWTCPAFPSSNCFFNGSSGGTTSSSDPDRGWKSMVGYPAYHSVDEKKFLGVTIAPQTSANPDASLKVGLDTLANHPNVGPFIGKQLIQRLVTSNPSPAYIAAVAAAFDNNGSGVRGDMKTVIKAVLLNPEARVVSTTSGKLREPILRLAAVMRAFSFASDTGNYRVGNTDNAGTQLGQTVMRSPSVFNFFRPGYIPPGTQSAAANLVVPEMQIAHETTAAGYVNYMRDNISAGVGSTNGAPFNRRDLQPNFSAELALAATSSALVDRMNDLLMYGAMPAALKTEIQGAVDKIVIPALNAAGSNQAAIDTAKRNRVNAAVFLTAVSPEFQVQK